MYNIAVRIYIAYQFSGQDKKYLKDMLVQISEKLHELGHETFNFYKDVQRWKHPVKNKKEIITLAFSAIDKCDGICAILENSKKKARE